MNALTQEEAHRLFEYRDGALYWKERPKHSRKSKDDFEAGTITTGGYKKITIRGVKYYAHRVIFLMHYGYMPLIVDHIDQNTKNNCVENLRESDKSKNACNSKMNIKNTSGHRGVVWHKKAKKWMVQLNIRNKSKYFGVFDNFELACLVSDEARCMHHGNYVSL